MSGSAVEVSEHGQRQRLIRALMPLHGVPIENPVQPGTPDINYINGWIECKWLRSWPVRASTPVRIEHFTIQQRRWLKKHCTLGGSAWLLLQVQAEWLLFSGIVAHDHVGGATRQELYDLASARWKSGLKNKELVECLTMEWTSWFD